MFCLLNSVVCIEFVYQTPRTGVSLESDESVFWFLSNYLLTGMGKMTMMCIICMQDCFANIVFCFNLYQSHNSRNDKLNDYKGFDQNAQGI